MSKKLTTEEFIEKAKLIHGEMYDYSKTVYTHSLAKLTITCKIHGDFEQTPSNHLQGSICKLCTVSSRTSSKEEFIKKANKVHTYKYDYSKIEYVNNKTNITIICPIHGLFNQTPNCHLKGQECPECGRLKCDEARKLTTKEFIEKAKLIHKDTYDYTITEYKTSKEEVQIICPNHGVFTKIAQSHLSGQGCPICTIYGFKKDKPAILYYLKITTKNGDLLYKIGITNYSVTERFNLTELSKIEVLLQRKYTFGYEAYKEEQRILKQFKKFKYKGPNILVNGNTEIFTKNVLKDTL